MSIEAEMDVASVYFIKDITPENIVKIYNALGRRAEGKVAVKLSTGEPGNNYHLAPQLIAPLVRQLNGTIVENNTAYDGGRDHTADHLKAAEEHGFTAIAPVVEGILIKTMWGKAGLTMILLWCSRISKDIRWPVSAAR